MAESTVPGEMLKFKAPGSIEWRLLNDDSEDDQDKLGAKAARASLKETLLASLQMQHIVVLAGSGTSLGQVGGPSMWDLWVATIGNPANADAAKAAKTINFDLSTKNIEEFLSKAESYLQVMEDSEVKAFVSLCKKVILEKCSVFVNAERLDSHRRFLHRLSRRRVRDPRLKVFTTNYDLCFEQAANALGGVVLDGFSFTPPRSYDPRYFGYDIIRRPRSSEDQGNYLEGVFLLFKLHGSVNWARNSSGVIQEKIDPKPDEACLIYPARGKYQQSFLQPHLESMSQYLATLREPNTCLIVTGFGFNDDHLSEPLLAAVRSNPHLRLIIVDPGIISRENEGTGANRYWQSFFNLAKDDEDVWFINASFQAISKLIPDLKSLTPAEKLLKAMKGVTESK